MSDRQKKNVILNVINKKTRVTDIAKQYDVSRQHVYYKKDRAISAVDDSFDETPDDNEKILFHIPVTKAWLDQLTICLMLHGRTSFRNFKSLIKDCFDHDISVGASITYSIALISATNINDDQGLSSVKLAEHDELYHHYKPVLAGVDIPSLYCYLLSSKDQRDSEPWAIHFMDLQQQKFKPERVIGDDGSGLRCAHEMILDDIPFDHDVFNLLKLLMDNAKQQGNSSSLTRELGEARKMRD